MFSSFIFHISALMIVKRQLFYFKCIIIVFLIFLRNIGRALDDTLGLGSYLWLLIFIKYLFIFLFLDNRNWSFYFCFLSRACPTTDKSLAIFCNSWYSWFRFTFSSLRYNIRIKFILCSRKRRQYTLILYFNLIIYAGKSTWRSCRLYIWY